MDYVTFSLPPNPFPLDGLCRHDHHFRHDPLSRRLPPRVVSSCRPRLWQFLCKKGIFLPHTPKCVWAKQNCFNHLEIRPKLVTPFIYRNKKKGKKTPPKNQSHSIYAAKSCKDCMSLDGHNRKTAQIQLLQNAHNQPQALLSIHILFFSLQSAG